MPEPGSNSDSSNVMGSASSLGGRFVALRLHAEGGLGRVSLALDRELHREVAVKQIKDRFADDENSRARFIREAEITGGLEHPGIVPVYGMGIQSDGRPFYAMRLIRGESLKTAIDRHHETAKKRGASSEQVVDLRKLLGRFVDVCEAMEYAHSRGIVHRDLKPSNIMLGKFGETLVVDWGLAKALGKGEEAGPVDEPVMQPHSGSGSAPTMMGVAIGTPEFMSPEQAAGRQDLVGPASDIYSLGATLYYLLTGQPPIGGENWSEQLECVRNGDFSHPRSVARTIPRALEAICLKAMALEPAARYASAAALADDVERFLADEAILAGSEVWSDRVMRWGRRHRALVASLIPSLLVLVIVLIGAAVLVDRRRQEAVRLAGEKIVLAAQEASARTDAEQQRNSALESKAISERLRNVARNQLAFANHRVYVGNMQQALEAWKSGRTDLALDLINSHRPALMTGGPPGWEWYFLRDLVAPAASIFQGQNALVDRMAFSADGNWLATASSMESLESNLCLWDLTMPHSAARKLALVAGVRGLAWSPRNATLACVDRKGAVVIWEASTPSEFLRVEGCAAVGDALAWSPDGQRLAIGLPDATVAIWSLKERRVERTWKGANAIGRLAWASGGKHLVSGLVHSSVQLVDALTGEPEHEWPTEFAVVPRRDWAPAFVLSADDRWLAYEASPRQVCVVALPSGRKISECLGHAAGDHRLAFSADARYLVSSGRDGTRIWHTASGGPPRKQLDETRAVWCDSDPILAVSVDRRQDVRLFDVERLEFVATLPGQFLPIHALAWNAPRRQVGSAGEEGFARTWNVENYPRKRTTLPKFGDQISWPVWSADGTRLAYSLTDNSVQVFEADGGTSVQRFTGFDQYPATLAWSADGRHMAVGGWDPAAAPNSEVRILEVESGKVLARWRAGDRIDQAAFSPDGSRLAVRNVGQNNWSIQIWDWREAKSVAAIGGEQGIFGFAWNPKGRSIAVGRNGVIEVWSSEGVRLSGKLDIPRAFVIEWSPDGRRIAAASQSVYERAMRMQVGDWESEVVLTGRESSTSWIMSVAWSSDGRQLLVNSPRSMEVWDAEHMSQVLILEDMQVESGGVRGVWSKDGQRILRSDGRTLWSLTGSRGPGDQWNGDPRSWYSVTVSHPQVESPTSGAADLFVRNWRFASQTRPWMDHTRFELRTPTELAAIERETADLPLERSDAARIDLNQRFPEQRQNTAAYAVRTIHCDEPRQVRFLVGGDDAIRVWLNGRTVIESLALSAAQPDQHLALLDLSSGTNTIVVEVSNALGAWAFYARLEDVHGDALRLTDDGRLATGRAR